MEIKLKRNRKKVIKFVNHTYELLLLKRKKNIAFWLQWWCHCTFYHLENLVFLVNFSCGSLSRKKLGFHLNVKCCRFFACARLATCSPSSYIANIKMRLMILSRKNKMRAKWKQKHFWEKGESTWNILKFTKI